MTTVSPVDRAWSKMWFVRWNFDTISSCCR